MIAIDEVTLNTFFAALTALILAIIAWYNKQRTTAAVQTATAATQTAMTNAVMAAATQPAAPASAAGFLLPRDGSKLLNGLDGWYARLNPSPQAATLPDEKCWQAVSPKGNFHSGDKDTIIYLITNADAAGWRVQNA